MSRACQRLTDGNKMQGPPDPELPFNKCFGIVNQCPPPVTVLSTIMEAHQHLAELATTWVREGSSRQADQPLYNERLGQWRSAFEALLASQEQSFTASEREGAAILEMHWRYLDIHRELTSVDQRMIEGLWYDKFQSYFETMVDLAAAAAEVVPAKGKPTNRPTDCPSDGALSSGPRSPTFSLDTTLNLSLFTIVLRCRDPAIRRRAIAVCRSANRQEGLWRSDLVARVCERIVELEEQDLVEVRSCHDVPSEARIQAIKVEFQPTGSAAILHYSLGGRTATQRLFWSESTA